MSVSVGTPSWDRIFYTLWTSSWTAAKNGSPTRSLLVCAHHLLFRWVIQKNPKKQPESECKIFVNYKRDVSKNQFRNWRESKPSDDRKTLWTGGKKRCKKPQEEPQRRIPVPGQTDRKQMSYVQNRTKSVYRISDTSKLYKVYVKSVDQGGRLSRLRHHWPPLSRGDLEDDRYRYHTR